MSSHYVNASEDTQTEMSERRFFFNELVFCDAEICNQSCLSKSMAEIQPVLTLAAEEKAVSVMCLR